MAPVGDAIPDGVVRSTPPRRIVASLPILDTSSSGSEQRVQEDAQDDGQTAATISARLPSIREEEESPTQDPLATDPVLIPVELPGPVLRLRVDHNDVQSMSTGHAAEPTTTTRQCPEGSVVDQPISHVTPAPPAEVAGGDALRTEVNNLSSAHHADQFRQHIEMMERMEERLSRLEMSPLRQRSSTPILNLGSPAPERGLGGRGRNGRGRPRGTGRRYFGELPMRQQTAEEVERAQRIHAREMEHRGQEGYDRDVNRNPTPPPSLNASRASLSTQPGLPLW